MENKRYEDLLDSINIFCADIRNNSIKYEENGNIPKKVFEEMAKLGLLSLPFPEEYGGYNASPLQYGLITKKIARADSNVRSILTVHTSLVGETILRWGSESQKNEYLPKMASGELIGAFALSEPNNGSDAKNIETNYRREEDSFILNGNKKWITLGGIADFMLVIARCNEKATAFLVDSSLPGITRTPITNLMSNSACYVSEINFRDVKVSASCILGKEGNGFIYIVNTALDYGRYSIAWGSVGLAEEAVCIMVDYSKKRKQFGEKICNYQLIQKIIADSVTDLTASNSLCVQAAEERESKSTNATMVTNIAKYFSSKAAVRIAADSIQVLGGNGCLKDFKVEKLFREAKVMEIIEGTNQIQQLLIAKYGLRHFSNKY